ncbi:hypothetical protein ACFWDA_21795, partial [Rhodococcus zopfii]
LRVLRLTSHVNIPPGSSTNHCQGVHSEGAASAPPIIGTLAVARAILQGETGTGGIVNDRSRLVGGDLSADWCLSPPEFHGDKLYVTCMDNGFMALQLDLAVYPPR